jgi:hypothetical protein
MTRFGVFCLGLGDVTPLLLAHLGAARVLQLLGVFGIDGLRGVGAQQANGERENQVDFHGVGPGNF